MGRAAARAVEKGGSSEIGWSPNTSWMGAAHDTCSRRSRFEGCVLRVFLNGSFYLGAVFWVHLVFCGGENYMQTNVKFVLCSKCPLIWQRLPNDLHD